MAAADGIFFIIVGGKIEDIVGGFQVVRLLPANQGDFFAGGFLIINGHIGHNGFRSNVMVIGKINLWAKAGLFILEGCQHGQGDFVSAVGQDYFFCGEIFAGDIVL